MPPTPPDPTSSTLEGRLVSVRWVVFATLLVSLWPLSFTTMTFVEGPPVAYAAAPIAAAGALLVAALLRALGRRRSRRDIAAAEEVTFTSSGFVTYALLAAWLLMVVAGAGWLALILTGVAPDPSRRWAVIGLTPLLSIPDLGRLMLGRLHRWRLHLGEDGLTYRGYRTDVSVEWRQVSGARTQRPETARRNGPDAQLVIALRNTDPVKTGPGRHGRVKIPLSVFDVPGSQLVEEVNRRRKAARR